MTLGFIASSNGTPKQEKDLIQESTMHAKQIEAVCWTPRIKMTDEEYSNLMLQKTKELCRLLVRPILLKPKAQTNTDQMSEQQVPIDIQLPETKAEQADDIVTPPLIDLPLQLPEQPPFSFDIDFPKKTKYDNIDIDPALEASQWDHLSRFYEVS